MIALPVSVVIPFYNGQAFLQRAIDSIQSQTVPPLEIVIVDDGSSVSISTGDITCSIPFKLIAHEVNKGIAAARNTGVAAASHPWIAFLDQDDEWLPHKLELQWNSVQAKREHSRDFLYYGRALRLDESRSELVWPHRSTMRRLDKAPAAALEDLVTRGNLVPFITILLAKDVWTAAGSFDEELRGGSDDYALMLRLAANGVRFCGVAHDAAIARRHETGLNYSRPERFLADDLTLLLNLGRDFSLAAPLIQRGLAAAHYRAGRALLDFDATQSREHLDAALALRPRSVRFRIANIAARSPAPARRALIACWRAVRRFYFHPTR